MSVWWPVLSVICCEKFDNWWINQWFDLVTFSMTLCWTLVLFHLAEVYIYNVYLAKLLTKGGTFKGGCYFLAKGQQRQNLEYCKELSSFIEFKFFSNPVAIDLLRMSNFLSFDLYTFMSCRSLYFQHFLLVKIWIIHFKPSRDSQKLIKIP